MIKAVFSEKKNKLSVSVNRIWDVSFRLSYTNPQKKFKYFFSKIWSCILVHFPLFYKSDFLSCQIYQETIVLKSPKISKVLYSFTFKKSICMITGQVIFTAMIFKDGDIF